MDRLIWVGVRRKSKYQWIHSNNHENVDDSIWPNGLQPTQGNKGVMSYRFKTGIHGKSGNNKLFPLCQRKKPAGWNDKEFDWIKYLENKTK